MAFYVIYIQEAHPIDAWQVEKNAKEGIFIASAKNFQERCGVANTCVTKLNIQIPALIDNLQNSTEAKYTAWPDRLYVIDQDGRVAYKSKPGPFGFHPEGVAQTLTRLLPPAPTREAELIQ